MNYPPVRHTTAAVTSSVLLSTAQRDDLRVGIGSDGTDESVCAVIARGPERMHLVERQSQWKHGRVASPCCGDEKAKLIEQLRKELHNAQEKTKLATARAKGKEHLLAKIAKDRNVATTATEDAYKRQAYAMEKMKKDLVSLRKNNDSLVAKNINMQKYVNDLQSDLQHTSSENERVKADARMLLNAMNAHREEVREWKEAEDLTSSQQKESSSLRKLMGRLERTVSSARTPKSDKQQNRMPRQQQLPREETELSHTMPRRMSAPTSGIVNPAETRISACRLPSQQGANIEMRPHNLPQRQQMSRRLSLEQHAGRASEVAPRRASLQNPQISHANVARAAVGRQFCRRLSPAHTSSHHNPSASHGSTNGSLSRAFPASDSDSRMVNAASHSHCSEVASTGRNSTRPQAVNFANTNVTR